MVFAVNPVVRLQGVVYRLTGEKKAASRGEVPGVFSSDALLEAPFQQNRASRFSTAAEQGLFYGSRSREGCLIEGAYYELFFYRNSEYFSSVEVIKISKILFQVEIDSENCLKLQERG